MLEETPEEIRKVAGVPAALCVFGKHAAWADHMEILGAVTPSLADFRRRFYQEGVSRQLDSGAWGALEEGCRIDGWNHEWLTFGSAGILVARAWTSTDSRGRSAYPMVGVIQLPTRRPPQTFDPLFALLGALEEECVARDDVDNVTRAVHAVAARLPETIAGLSPQHEEGVPVSERRGALAAMDGDAPPLTALARVFHHWGILPEFGVPLDDFRGTARLATGKHGFGSGVCLWRCLLAGCCPPGRPLTATRHRDSDWMDLEVGDFSESLVFRLKASRKEIPIVTDIPFSVPDETRAVVEAYAEAFCRGEPPAGPKRATGLWSRLGARFSRKPDG